MSYAPTPWHWMLGRRDVERGRPVEVVLAPWTDRHACAVVARIDPPLFLGLSAIRSSTDRWFEHTGWDPNRVKRVMDEMRAPMSAFGALSPTARVMDSTVAVDFFVTAPAEDLVRFIDECTTLAVKLSTVRSTLPRTAGELEQEATWRAFAETMGFSFDGDRMDIVGTVAGAKLRITLEAEAFGVSTTVVVDFPGSAGLSLSITRQKGPALVNALTGVVDLPTGDAAFDDAFIVSGTPAVTVQRLFWNVTLRRAVFDLGGAAVVFELGDAHLFARYASPLREEGELGRLVDRIATVVTTLFPNAAQGEGPYR